MKAFCRFCSHRAKLTFYFVPVCRRHLTIIGLALLQEWHD